MAGSSSSSSSTTGGIGFAGALTILFVALKLTHVIDWDWWWVLSPLWITAGLVIAIFAVVIGIALAFSK